MAAYCFSNTNTRFPNMVLLKHMTYVVYIYLGTYRASFVPIKRINLRPIGGSSDVVYLLREREVRWIGSLVAR